MIITLDEFFDIMGLSLSKKKHRSVIYNQYLMNKWVIKIPEVVRKLMGKKTWPMLGKNGQQYIRLKDLSKEYSEYVNWSML